MLAVFKKEPMKRSVEEEENLRMPRIKMPGDETMIAGFDQKGDQRDIILPPKKKNKKNKTGPL